MSGYENPSGPTDAVIYCRVSSAKQKVMGDGLSSQETRCREYARGRGYDVVEVFVDDDTGGKLYRPGMDEMLAYLKKEKPKRQHIVIIDDINRFSRDVVVHWELRARLAQAGGVLKSPSMEFGDDSDSVLIENLLASVSQHQRQKNGEQTINRMRARITNGYWVFPAPIGYRYQRVSGHNNLLVRIEPVASILAEALEGYACGRFQTQVEVKRFLEAQPLYPKDLPDGQIRNQRIHDILTRPVYAGYVEAPKWGVALRKGHHDGLVSFETFQRIQDRLTGTAKAPARKDINADFPLRGFILCDDCSKPLTACWSKSKTGAKHPYYLCPTKGCGSYRKSIRRDQLEGDFDTLLEGLQPSKGLFAVAKAMFKDAWDMRLSKAAENAKSFEKEALKAEKQIEGLLDRIVTADNESVVAAYEKRIGRLEREKALLVEKAENVAKPRYAREELFELALQFLSTPYNIYRNGSLAVKKTVLRLAFYEPVSYHRKEGVRTPALSFPFKALAELSTGKCEMAHLRGFEPLASAFGGQRSIQLSYRCLWRAYMPSPAPSQSQKHAPCPLRCRGLFRPNR